MKIKICTTKINFIFISIFRISGSVGPVKQLIKLVSPYFSPKNWPSSPKILKQKWRRFEDQNLIDVKYNIESFKKLSWNILEQT